MSEQIEVRASEVNEVVQVVADQQAAETTQAEQPAQVKKPRAKRVRKASTESPTGELNVGQVSEQVVAALSAAGWSAAYVVCERGEVSVCAKRGQVLAGPYVCGDVQLAEQLVVALHAAKVARVVLKVGSVSKTGTPVRGRSVSSVLTA
jgi:hypothetical protein